ncbi:mannitol dehydrogenase family protein [Caproicibacter sp.]|uniref:mannitol dehydrogenase family protein n=1 Tax=Caproicibacter sp. TaxID=2814884 RepID=UPI003988CAFA
MKLNLRELKNQSAWQKAEIRLPRFNLEKVRLETQKSPTWIHFGAGNIFRAFLANVQQNLLNDGVEKTGIIVAEGYDYEIIEKTYRPHDNLSLLVTLKADGKIEKTVVGSITESLIVDGKYTEDVSRLKEIFTSISLQMVSFTITEKGYCLTRPNGELLPDVEEDFANGMGCPKSYIGKLVSLLHERYLAGKLPLALVSMDNCSHNGSKLYEAVNRFAREWVKNGFVDEGFSAYLNNQKLISFPWTMIDKITPRPDEGVREMLSECGFEDTADIVTRKHTYSAPFVNSEEVQYLVAEDWFPNGRPMLERGGVIFTTRETVDKVEKMKVCTCLNPLHTALAIFGCLLSFTKISSEMKDPDLRKLVEIIGYREGLPVVVNPGIIDPRMFIDEVLNIRIPNPFMPDTPQRIATDTSQKIPIRFGETIKAYLRSETLKVQDLRLIPLVLAGWCRYLMGIDDSGKPFEVSSDPMYESVSTCLSHIKLGQKGPFHTELEPIFSNDKIFGVNLYEVGLGDAVEKDFEELVSGAGAVRSALKKHLSEEA